MPSAPGPPSTPSSASRAFTSDDQVKFLISCIKHSNAGKPDFGQVAEDLGTTKGAAAKRYERILKANNIPSLSEQAKGAKATNIDTKGGSNNKGNTTPAAAVGDSATTGFIPINSPSAGRNGTKRSAKSMSSGADDDEDMDDEGKRKGKGKGKRATKVKKEAAADE